MMEVKQGVTVKNMTPGASTDDPYVIHPHYTGRDKGALGSGSGVLAFYQPGDAWKYVFEQVQPNDDRASRNYRVIRLSEYLNLCDSIGLTRARLNRVIKQLGSEEIRSSDFIAEVRRIATRAGH